MARWSGTKQPAEKRMDPGETAAPRTACQASATRRRVGNRADMVRRRGRRRDLSGRGAAVLAKEAADAIAGRGGSDASKRRRRTDANAGWVSGGSAHATEQSAGVGGVFVRVARTGVSTS